MSGRHFLHVGDRQKCLLFEGCSRQTHLPTLPAKLIALVLLVEIFGWMGGWFVIRRGFGGLVVCVLDKKLGKMQSTIDGPWRPPRHMAAMGPHPRQQNTRQSTNIIFDGSTSLKLEKYYLLLVILLLMHAFLTSTSNDDDVATRRWVRCSSLNDIANSDSMLLLSMIYSTMAGGGGRGEGVVDE